MTIIPIFRINDIVWTIPTNSIHITCHKMREQEKSEFKPISAFGIFEFQKLNCYHCPINHCPFHSCKNQYAPNDLKPTNKIQYLSITDTYDCQKCEHYTTCERAHKYYAIHMCMTGERENIPKITGCKVNEFEEEEKCKIKEEEHRKNIEKVKKWNEDFDKDMKEHLDKWKVEQEPLSPNEVEYCDVTYTTRKVYLEGEFGGYFTTICEPHYHIRRKMLHPDLDL